MVIGVHMGDDDAGHPVRRDARRGQAAQQVLPAGVGVPAGINSDNAAIGVNQVGKRVAQRAIRDRHRNRPEAGSDLLDRGELASQPRLPLGYPGDDHRAPRVRSAAWC